MRRFFISFTKQELKTCILLGISSELMSLSGVTVSLAGITDLETSFLSCPASAACIGGTCVGVACSAGNTCIKGTGTEGTYAKSTCTGFIGAAGTESACTGSAGAVKHSKIHSQSFLILEVELFDIG